MNPADQKRQLDGHHVVGHEAVGEVLRGPGTGPDPQEPGGEEQEPDYRFTLANERTFLAWIRTALALIAGGVAVVQLVPEFGIPGGRHALGVLLTAGGGLLAALAVRRWQRVQAAMRRDAELPSTRLPVLLGSALLAVTILVLVVLLVPHPMWP
jgi:putative membrane protein